MTNNERSIQQAMGSNPPHLKTFELVPGRDETDEEILAHLVKALRPIVDEAVNGESSVALKCLRQVHRLVRPDLYELPPSVARAMEIYQLMFKLSRVVKPIRGVSFLRKKKYVRLTEDEGWKNFNEYKLAKRHLQRRKSERFTLQTLAISIFLEQANKEGLEGLSQRSVERDLRAARLYSKKLGKKASSLHAAYRRGVITVLLLLTRLEETGELYEYGLQKILKVSVSGCDVPCHDEAAWDSPERLFEFQEDI